MSDTSPVASSTSSELTITATQASGDVANVGSLTITSSSKTSIIASTATPTDFGDAGKSITTTPSPTAQSDDHGNFGTVVVLESDTTTQSPTYVSAAFTTLTDSLGMATYTSTCIPAAISTPMTTVLTNSPGQVTVTVVTNAAVSSVTGTLVNAEGLATATVTSYPVIPSDTTVHTRVFFISYAEYFVGFFLPTLLSILLAITIRVLDLNAKLFQPWHELTHEHGARGRESLCLETSGWKAVIPAYAI
ncbi:hypothetical protein SUNI508_09514 [Seiridium unicorne]|uniref:Uncharacterized protein n=1 Tax=Seiridium unicorne TaxID=138068 RepID=A0ABR2UPY4_9PEZI